MNYTWLISLLFYNLQTVLDLGCAPQDCFLLDTGSGVYVWIGSGSSKQEKVKSMEMAGQCEDTFPLLIEVSFNKF